VDGAHLTFYLMGTRGCFARDTMAKAIVILQKPPSSTEVKDNWGYTSTLLHISMMLYN